MSAIAHIGREDFLRQHLSFFVGYRVDGGIHQIFGDGTIQRHVDGEIQTEPSKPSFTLPEDVARALLSELIRHFDGGEDTRTLRKDYDAERARVDKLTDAVIGIAAGGMA